jgi:hypothetical protein
LVFLYFLLSVIGCVCCVILVIWLCDRPQYCRLLRSDRLGYLCGKSTAFFVMMAINGKAGINE